MCMKRAISTALVTVVLLAGCSADEPDAATTTTAGRPTSTTAATNTTVADDPDPDDPGPTIAPPGGTFGRSRLSFFSDCSGLADYLRTEAGARVTAWGLGGGPYYYPTDGPMREMAAADQAAPAASGAPASTVPASSSTNTQEVGVDEGDTVETNGTHVFVAGQDGVRVIDVAEARVVETIDVPEGTHQLLLDDDRLLVVTQPWSGAEDTVTSLYDVTDPGTPTLLRRSHLEGRIVATRAIDGTARLVITSSLAARLPFVYPQQFGLDEVRALAENRRIIAESEVEAWLPRWFDEAGDGSFGEMGASLDCATVAAPDDFAGLGISWIASIDMHAGTSPVGVAGVVSNGEIVYASSTNIYLATVSWDWYYPVTGTPASNQQPPTMIHQFSLGDDGSATYVASGAVPGQLINQFAMSELDGDLRVATTTTDWNGTNASESAVYVLRPQGSELVQVGAVGGLGVTEQIYAVRFLGTQAYVVTFRQTDPLYVIDLADPTNPVVSGELKIPGYSSYLHPVGDGLLLGVGQDAGLDGRTQGTKLSLFDVSDPANPREISSLPIGGYSDAEWDHHAFLYWPEDGTIVIPVSSSWQGCGRAIDCLAADISSPGGGVVVAQLQGTQLVGTGTIQHEYDNGSGCWNPLQRSMIIGSEIVTIGFDQVKFTDRSTLVGRDVVRWGQPENYGCYYYGEG